MKVCVCVEGGATSGFPKSFRLLEPEPTTFVRQSRVQNVFIAGCAQDDTAGPGAGVTQGDEKKQVYSTPMLEQYFERAKSQPLDPST